MLNRMLFILLACITLLGCASYAVPNTPPTFYVEGGYGEFRSEKVIYVFRPKIVRADPSRQR
jgi:hypothetical protein